MAISLKRTIAAVSAVLAAAWFVRTASAAPPVGASGEFPYVAYVIEPDTYIRSGPGNQHYATGQLAAGYAVEVYRHDAEGWCAIRPPEASFSLVGAHQLKIIDAHTAEVASDGVVARVGSSLGEQRTAVQVMLQRGERLQVLEAAAPGNPWVKIAPPRGEFRWIAARRLSRLPPVESPPAIGGNGWQSRGLGSPVAESAEAPSDGRVTAWPASGPVTTPSAENGGTFTHLQPTSLGGSTTSAEIKPITDAKLPWQPSALPHAGQATAAPNGGEPIEIVAGSPADVRRTQYEEPIASASAASAGTPSNETTIAAGGPAESAAPRIRFRGQGGPLDERVAEIETRLSQIVVQPPESWQLAPIRTEAATRLAQEESPEVREQLRDLLDRVATFESVQAKYRTPNGQPSPVVVAALAPAAAAQAASQPMVVAGTAAGQPAAVSGTLPATSEGLTSNSSNVLARVRSDLGFDDGITPTPGGPTAAAPMVAAAEAKPATEALYDAVGTLKPVVSRRAQAPQFALVDDHGDVVTFVTASADVNLQSFVGQRIGVRGSRGFMPEYRRAHVTASRVTQLEQRLVK
jgi:hypothetical protein